MSAQSLVDEQLKALSSLCDLDADTRAAFSGALMPIAEAHFAKMSTTAQSGGKIKLSKKEGATKTRATKPKEDKISNKNAYHVFVSAKMAEVKGNNVPAKERMTAIGQLWKELDDAGREPYKQQAAAYNVYIAEAMKAADWKDRRKEIVDEANAHAGTSGAEEATETVAETVAPTPVAVPAPAAPAPVRRATKAKVGGK